MAKKNNIIYWIIGIVIFFLVITQTNIFKKQETEMLGLNIHYYKDGVEIFPTKGFFGFSIVTPPGGTYDQIAFDIPATNTGDVPITNIQIVDASPLAFKNALPSTTQSLLIGESKTLWTSGLIDTVQFEGQIINFWIKILGDHPDLGTTYAEKYSGDITFETEDPPPIITVAIPEQGGQYNSPITFEIYTNEIVEAQISIDGGIKKGMNYAGGAPFNLKWVYTSTLSGGAHSVTFYATDVGLNTAEKSVSFEICTSHLTYSCYGGDIYWYDSCGVREEKKEECGTFMCSGGACVFSSFYQETADTYSFTDDWAGSSYCAFDWNKFKDGNWNSYLTTASKGGACAGQATMTYNKPVGATSTIWKVKDEYGTKNLNIPSVCWSASSTDLTLRYRSHYSSSSNFLLWECYDGGTGHEGFNVLWNSPSRPGFPVAYEEAVTWN